jgi:2-polyprenyl-6-methoxyphenol hydroxylase-like FAD-dependent oxidoreductase
VKDPAKATLLRCFGGWHSPIGGLIGAACEDAILRRDIHDREPLGERWGRGRVTLLGDAAHPMTPDLGQGAALAMEDEAALARCLEEFGATADALRRYERLRSARAAIVVRRSRRLGRVG